MDVNPALFDRELNARLDLYQDDLLHLRPAAYVALAAIIKPVVVRAWQETLVPAIDP